MFIYSEIHVVLNLYRNKAMTVDGKLMFSNLLGWIGHHVMTVSLTSCPFATIYYLCKQHTIEQIR